MTPPAAILDVDGTLVDTNYQHAVAWYRAFRQQDLILPIARIHRHMGMGGDQIVGALAGEEWAEEHGDDVRAAEKALYLAMIEEVEPLDGARVFIVALKEAGHPVILASSAKAEEIEHYIELLDAREVVDGWTTSADVENTKPAPDLVHAALEKLGNPEQAVMLGDTPFDIEAAKKAGVPTLAILTGGFGADELHEAGAFGVYGDIAELRAEIGKTPLKS